MHPGYLMALLLAILHMLSELIHHRERKDLMNRIMAKDMREYQAVSKDGKQNTVPNPIRTAVEKQQQERQQRR